MEIYNFLPLFQECIYEWRKVPTRNEFQRAYLQPLSERLQDLLEDFGVDFYSVLKSLNWDFYRAEVLALNPEKEEIRLKKHIQKVEELFGFPLQGETVLFGAFTLMDGYARFNEGRHRVYLGVDESHRKDPYLDVLMAHELTHVARESQESIWHGFGLNPKMTHDEFAEELPVIEHLMNEGFSCVVSEILVPGHQPWQYTYQPEATFGALLENASSLNQQIKKELKKSRGNYRSLYNSNRYGKGMPDFCHYVWAWQWVKKLLKEHGDSNPRNLVSRCSRDFIQHALEFELKEIK